MLRSLILLSFLWFEFQVTASFLMNDTVNRTDEQGRKQGYWEKAYPNGNIMYRGYFKDDKPVKEMRRYYETGELKAIMYFRPGKSLVKTIFYYDDGQIAGEGYYRDNRKDSLWTYYSFYTGAITSTETYCNGMKNGRDRKYYPGGAISEELEYKDNLREGVWKQYFEDGTLKQVSAYINDKVNGPYKLYWPNGNIYIEGRHVDNKRDGEWRFYSETGQLKYNIDYKMGFAENEEEIMARDKDFFKMVEENMGKFQDPTVEDVMPGAGRYY